LINGGVLITLRNGLWRCGWWRSRWSICRRRETTLAIVNGDVGLAGLTRKRDRIVGANKRHRAIEVLHEVKVCRCRVRGQNDHILRTQRADDRVLATIRLEDDAVS